MMRTKSHASPKTDVKPSKTQISQLAIPVPAKAIMGKTGMAPIAPQGGSNKMQLCLGLLGRRDGVTIAELALATGWQTHSVRGFLSGTVKKKLGLLLDSSKNKNGVRLYWIDRKGGARG